MFPAAYNRHLATALAGAALASALAVSGASAHQSTKSPEAVPPPPPSLMAASAAEEYAELRSAGRDSDAVPPPPSSMAASAAEEYAELRSPDQDSQPVPADEPAPSDGFDVLSAAIGAAAGAGVVIVAAAGLVRRRPLAVGQSAGGA
jgi:hypothetical protein